MDEVKHLWMATDFLKPPSNWPDGLTATKSVTNPASAADKILTWRPLENNQTSPLVHAVQRAAFHVNWHFINTKEEVGQHFLDNDPYFELTRPTRHFRSD